MFLLLTETQENLQRMETLSKEEVVDFSETLIVEWTISLA